MSDIDKQKLREQLAPVLQEAGAPGVKPPACYRFVCGCISLCEIVLRTHVRADLFVRLC